MIRNLRHLLEATLFLLAYIVFRLLPLDIASALGAKLFRLLGPCLYKLSHFARTNIAIAFPEKSPEEREKILHGMWENLGRVAAEYAHLRGMQLISRVSFSGLENLPQSGRPGLFVSGHYGNWELGYPIAYEYGIPITLIYRHANNPFIDRMILHLRCSHSSDMLPKGLLGAARLGKALRRGESFAILIDQKMNEGIPVPFFGREAMTAPAVAQFALRFEMPIVPARVVRTKGAHFRATVYPALSIPRTGNDEQDIKTIMTKLNAMLEDWIREHPEQWYWVHRRFDKALY